MKFLMLKTFLWIHIVFQLKCKCLTFSHRPSIVSLLWPCATAGQPVSVSPAHPLWPHLSLLQDFAHAFPCLNQSTTQLQYCCPFSYVCLSSHKPGPMRLSPTLLSQEALSTPTQLLYTTAFKLKKTSPGIFQQGPIQGNLSIELTSRFYCPRVSADLSDAKHGDKGKLTVMYNEIQKL